MVGDLTGHQLDGYRLKKRLGEGTFGMVYLADDLRRKREVAIKVVDPATTTQDQFYRKVNAVAWSPDGERLASSSYGVVLIWQEG